MYTLKASEENNDGVEPPIFDQTNPYAMESTVPPLKLKMLKI